MKLTTAKNGVAVLIVVGHIAVFSYGLYLAILGVLPGEDGIETVLMVSPLLAGVALAAFTYVINLNPSSRKTVGAAFVFLVFFVPCASAAIMLFTLFAVHQQWDGFGVHQLKIVIGSTETALGGFLGVISRKLFGEG